MRTLPSALPSPDFLPHREVRRAVRGPVDRARIELVAGAVEHAHLHARDIAWVLAHLHRDILLQDRQRHRPRRIEIHRRDAGGERGRGAVDLADHRDVAARDLAVFDRLCDRGRNVHHHVALAEGEAHAVQPVERGRELADARLHRNVERLDGLRADRAKLRESVARLEALHGFGQHRVVGVALRDFSRQVVGDRETLAQFLDVGAGRTGRKVHLRDRGPAAAHFDRRIGEHRLIDAVVGAFVEGRFGRGPETRDAALDGLWLRQRRGLRERRAGGKSDDGGECKRAQHWRLSHVTSHPGAP